MICDLGFRGTGHAQRLVDPAEVVAGESSSIRSPQVFLFFTEGVPQASRAAHLRSDRDGLALYVRRAQISEGSGCSDLDSLRVRHVRSPVMELAFGIVDVDPEGSRRSLFFGDALFRHHPQRPEVSMC